MKLSSMLNCWKKKPSSACKLRQLVNEFGENIFSADNKILFCKICEVTVASIQKCKVFRFLVHINHRRINMSMI